MVNFRLAPWQSIWQTLQPILAECAGYWEIIDIQADCLRVLVVQPTEWPAQRKLCERLAAWQDEHRWPRGSLVLVNRNGAAAIRG